MNDADVRRRAGWRTFGVLLLGALVAGLAVLPYQAALLGPAAARSAQPVGTLLAASVVQTLVTATIAAGLGLWLGPRVALGAPVLHAWLAGDRDAPNRLRAALTRARPPAAWIYWLGNVLAALAFGAGHLPATAALLPLTSIVVVRALVLNGLPGMVFGWLYWRRGLLPAMAAHFAADIVLHAIAGPLLAGGT